MEDGFPFLIVTFYSIILLGYDTLQPNSWFMQVVIFIKIILILEYASKKKKKKMKEIEEKIEGWNLLSSHQEIMLEGIIVSLLYCRAKKENLATLLALVMIDWLLF